MRDEGRLRGARSLALYLLSLNAVANALLAWPSVERPTAAAIGAAGLGLAIAVAMGEWLSPRLDAILERRARSRLRASVAAAYAGLSLLGLSAAIGAGEAGLVAAQVGVFVLAQCLLLAFIEVLGGALLALANALVLVVLATLAGGPPAAAAVVGYLGFAVFFLTFDHFLRRLAPYPPRRAALLGAAMAQALTAAVPAVLALSALLAVAPPRPYAKIERSRLRPASDSPAMRDAYSRLLLLAVLGGALVMLSTRLLRPRGGGGERTEEVLESERAAEEPLEETGERARTPEVAGARARIVRAYLRFLEQAERRGLRRLPASTPEGIAVRVGEPAQPLGRLTGLFMDARYGPEEPGAEAVRAAESASEQVVAHLKRRRRS